jgi:hypothetical protein
MCGYLLAAATSWAQQASAIVGVAKDTSGAVLPGVTVEASSPVLIEKVKTAVTDSDGRYTIVDLRPGAYAVTFTLAGFRTLKHEDVALTAGFTATVNADMALGTLEETITVTGATPLVDTQNSRQQKVVSEQLLNSLPTNTKSLATLINLTPGVSGAPDVGGASGIYRSNQPRLNMYHGKASSKYAYDGMNVMGMGAVGSTGYIVNASTAVELAIETGGGSAESEASGIVMNMVPKEGGNTVTGNLVGFFTNDRLQASNLTDDLRAQGLTTSNKVLHLYDATAVIGGPIKRDRLWFLSASRAAGNKNLIPGVFYNATRGTPIYTPDLSRAAYRWEHLKSTAVRTTWQATQKNKINAFVDIQSMALFSRGDFVSPEAAGPFPSVFWPSGLAQVTWSSPRTSRRLLEAGVSFMDFHAVTPKDPATTPTDISILESSTGFRYNAAVSYNETHQARDVQRFSASYVIGSHVFKSGVMVEEAIMDLDNIVNGDLTYTFLRGVPSSLTQFATPYLSVQRMWPDLGLYAQDQWKMPRLTLNYGLRFDYFRAHVPAQHVPATRFVPTARDFPRLSNVPNWKDLNPRLGVSYDLLGNGRTALKASLGRFVGAASTNLALAANPVATSVNSVTRTWNDTNGDFKPTCDLQNFSANGECGAISNVNFGKPNITTRYADDILRGWGARDYFWDLSAEVQHQLTSGMSMTAGYYRNWSNHFSSAGAFDPGATDNLQVTPADFSPYCVTAPRDPRLPGGGGYQVCGLYDVAPAKFGLVDNLITRVSHYGKQERVSDFLGVTVNGRFGSRVQIGGGLDTGRTVTDKCYVVDSPQQLLNCRVVSPLGAQTQVKLYGTYQLPADVVLSAMYQDVAGPEILANYTATNAEIAPSLGRNLGACRGAAVCTATATVPLVAPQTLFEDRRRSVDVRASKRIKLGGARSLQANLDIYNVFNANSVLSLNNTFGPRWQFPIGTLGAESLLWGRMFQLGGNFTF